MAFGTFIYEEITKGNIENGDNHEKRKPYVSLT